MACTIKVDQPNLGDGGSMYIHGLGAFKNGVYDISDAEEENFRIVNTHDEGKTDTDTNSDTYGSYIPKMVTGPSLEDAIDSIYGVTIISKPDENKPNVPPTGTVAPSSSEGPGATEQTNR